MRKVLILLSIFLFSFRVDDKLVELIRFKVENLSVLSEINSQNQIYCIPSIKEAYLQNSFEPFWGTKRLINDFLEVVEKSESDGLRPEDYHFEQIMELKDIKGPESSANLDILLTDAFLLYTSHLISGKVNPLNIDPAWHVLKTEFDPVKLLFQLKAQPLEALIKEIAPSNINYSLLKQELKRLKEVATEQTDRLISKGKMIKPGEDDPRIPLIREKIIFLKNMVDVPDSGSYYDETLKNAIVGLQERHGLEALGNIGDQTIEVLNIPLTERLKTIEINLERLRWLPQKFPSYYLLVNIAGFNLRLVDDGALVKEVKVIVGKPYRKTPVFTSTMQYLVFNPTWTVPPTILRNDVIPEVRRDKNYLSKKNINVYNAKGLQLNIDSVDWSSNQVYSYTYRQEPGKTNALGDVKFMFPNNYNVYLHDTPSRELFMKTERAFSSGCIRVHEPLDLAAYLLKDQKGFSINEINKIIKNGATQTVLLKRKPEVYLIYLTSWVDENGELNFRKDIYDRDEKLYQALQQDPVFDLKL